MLIDLIVTIEVDEDLEHKALSQELEDDVSDMLYDMSMDVNAKYKVNDTRYCIRKRY